MSSETNANPALPQTLTAGYDPLSHSGDVVARQVNITTDSSVTPNVVYGDLAMSPSLYNGASFDQQRGNLDNLTILASGVVNANSNSADLTNYNHRGIILYISPGTFGSGASAITVTIQGKDPVSGTYYTILTSASLTASTFATLTVYPGNTVSANVSASTVLPRTWRVSWNASAWGTGGSTLGIAAALIV